MLKLWPNNAMNCLKPFFPDASALYLDEWLDFTLEQLNVADAPRLFILLAGARPIVEYTFKSSPNRIQLRQGTYPVNVFTNACNFFPRRYFVYTYSQIGLFNQLLDLLRIYAEISNNKLYSKVFQRWYANC